MNHTRKLLLATTAWLALASGLSARTLNWGSDPGSALYDSSAVLLGGSYIFEIGSFGSSFDPTELNMNDWLTNWKTFDRATAPAGSGWNPAAGYFTSSASLLTNGTSSEATTWSLPAHTFAANERAYIFVYDSLSLGSSEWALYTNGFDGNAADDWRFPSPSDQTGLPLTWLLADATYTPFGAINNVQGPGSYTSDPGTFDLQTHATLAPVPEPSGALLIASAGVILLLRRRLRL